MRTDLAIDFSFFSDADARELIGVHDGAPYGTRLVIGPHDQTDDGHACRVPIPQVNDDLQLEIPSGAFAGRVLAVRVGDLDETGRRPVQIQAAGTWEGKWAGLEGGMTLYGRFAYFIFPSALIESTWGSMTEAQYRALRGIRNAFDLSDAEIKALAAELRYQHLGAMANYIMLAVPAMRRGVPSVKFLVCQCDLPYEDREVRPLFKRILAEFRQSEDWGAVMGGFGHIDWATLIATLPDRVLAQHGLRVLPGTWAVYVPAPDEVIWTREDGVLPG